MGLGKGVVCPLGKCHFLELPHSSVLFGSKTVAYPVTEVVHRGVREEVREQKSSEDQVDNQKRELLHSLMLQIK